MSGKTKLSDNDVRKIRQCRNAGFRIKALAIAFGVHRNTISSITRGIARKSVK